MTQYATNWPTSTDYTSAVQMPDTAFVAPSLASTRPVTSALGVPTAATGQNAVVFLLEDPHRRYHALRCFTSAPSDGRTRYLALSAHVGELTQPTTLAGATWIDEGIVLQGRSWPVVMMPWIAGRRLDIVVEELVVDDPRRLGALADALYRSVGQLQATGIAHGDLQHGNILVGDDLSITLVDLDGVWVSSASYPPPDELGHPNYQHPHRSEQCWGPLVDSFSALLIDVSLRALAADPSLADQLGGENLVLRQTDLVDLSAPVWPRLQASPDEWVRAGAERLRGLLGATAEATLLPLDQMFRRSEQSSVIDQMRSAAPVTGPVPGALDNRGLQEANWWDYAETSAANSPTVSATPPRYPGSAAVGHGASSLATGGDRGPAGSPSKLRSGPIGSALGGVLAGLAGCLLFGLVEPSIHHAARAGVFIALVAGLIGAAVLGWDGWTSGRASRAATGALTGFALAAIVALIALPVADLILQGPIENARVAAAIERGTSVDAVTEVDVPVVAVAVAWAVVAAVVGLALGARQSARAALFGVVAGAFAGFVGGLLHATTAASIFEERLRVRPFNPSTLAATAVVSALIGLAVATARRSGALAVLTVMEGRMAGSEVLLKDRNTIGSDTSARLVLQGPGVLGEHAAINIVDGRGQLIAFGSVHLSGRAIPGDPSAAHPLQSGDVVRVGGSYIRFTQRAAS